MVGCFACPSWHLTSLKDDENIQEQYWRLKVSLKENIIIMTRITTSMSLKT